MNYKVAFRDFDKRHPPLFTVVPIYGSDTDVCVMGELRVFHPMEEGCAIKVYRKRVFNHQDGGTASL